MAQKSWKKRLEALMAELMEENLIQYRNSKEYRKNCRKVDAAWEKLDETGVTKKQKRAAEAVAVANVELDADYIRAAYIQGIRDGMSIKKYFSQIG